MWLVEMDQGHLVAVGTTRGTLHLYRLGQGLAHVVTTVQVHASGVNCLTCAFSQGQTIVCSGGDDASLAIVRICSSTDPIVHRVPNAHASSITDVHLLDDGTLLSVGTDQRLKRWSIHPNHLHVESWECVDVPDPSAMAVLHQHDGIQVAVVGVGVQTFFLQ
jgi:WD40 repeat protein